MFLKALEDLEWGELTKTISHDAGITGGVVYFFYHSLKCGFSAIRITSYELDIYFLYLYPPFA